MAKAANMEMAILPKVIPNAMTRLLSIISQTGAPTALAPSVSAL